MARTEETPFSRRFKQALADLDSQGMSQGDVAKLLDFSENTISSWKLGVHRPRLKNLEAIAKTLDIPVEEFSAGRVGFHRPPPGREDLGDTSEADALVEELADLDLLGPLETLVKEEQSLRKLAARSHGLIDLLKAAQRRARG